jgi:hypothetical protein
VETRRPQRRLVLTQEGLPAGVFPRMIRAVSHVLRHRRKRSGGAESSTWDGQGFDRGRSNPCPYDPGIACCATPTWTWPLQEKKRLHLIGNFRGSRHGSTWEKRRLAAGATCATAIRRPASYFRRTRPPKPPRSRQSKIIRLLRSFTHFYIGVANNWTPSAPGGTRS